MVVSAFAAKRDWKFKKKRELKGELTKGAEGDRDVYLLLPTTYMNLSGSAVVRTIDYFEIPVKDILIVSDDVALPFGKYRQREKGSAGGHNGLKSITSALRTEEYQRLRIGIGDRDVGYLEDYVLGNFTKEEQSELPRIFEEGISHLEKWIRRGNGNES